MTSSSTPNCSVPSAAMLLNPKQYQNQVANGNAEQRPSLSYFTSPPAPRPFTESPPPSSTTYTTPHATSYSDSETNVGSKGRVKPQVKPKTNENVPPHFDPRQLLNPKGFQSAQAKKRMEETVPHEAAPENELQESSPSPRVDSGASTNSKRSFEDFNQDNDYLSRNLIDKLHNVQERGKVPQKKVRRGMDDDNLVESKPIQSGSRGSGGLGEYFKEAREEEEHNKKRSTFIVDLTAEEEEEEDDDEIAIIGEKMIGLEEVCYGRIADATVASHKVPKPSGRMVIPEDTWPMMKVELRREQGKSAMIRVVDPSGAIFGTLDSKTANALTPLIDSPTINLRTQVRLMMRQKRRDEWPGQPCSASLQLSINLYGPRKHGPAIGKFLGQHNVWLSTPPMVDAGIQVVNPHVNNPKANKAPSSMRGPQNYEYNYETQTLDEQHAAIGQMFDSMKVEDIPEMEPPSAVITPMLRHQKQALHFMTQKEKPVTFGKKEDETSTLWRIKFRPNGQKYYYNIITGNETPDEPAQVFGGILADMMGLGKTLSILSLVVSSLPQAEAWTSRTPEPVGPYAGLRRCKTTLLVSPLSAVVNWEEQIKTHIQDGALSSYVYHGSSRISDVDELAQYDVVITTYSIVLSDLEGRRNKTAKARKSPLAQLNFFRIVLDEAHIIREQSTGQSQVVCLLPADRRWAVTGTPVQNRLDDFAALTKFLRLAPLDNKVVFARAILTPFKMLNADVVPKLQLLVSSITLRRLKDRIELPKRHDQVVKLTFSEDEQALHDFFRKESELKVKVLTGKDKVGAGMYHHILLALLKLRLISAHGKELLKEDDLKRLRGSTAKDAIDLDDEDSYKVDTKNAYEIFELRLKHSLHECAECTEVLGQEAKEETLGYVLPCHCLVCRECYVSSRSPARKMIDANEHITCPYCQANVQATSYIITRRGLENYRESHDEVSRDTSQTKAITHYGGPHTKTKALISHLRQSIQQSSLLPEGESPIKSVVFSGWTSHLNLIQIALEDNQIPFARLDGSMTRTARSAALTAFSSDPSILVLLVTIGAGGVGLNLTSASNVYVMEPQFNPAAESQAIDRIHRLGQKREVMTTRFIMEGSIEEKIQEIQRKKQSLADLSMDRGKALSKKETALEKLKELRSLFK